MNGGILYILFLLLVGITIGSSGNISFIRLIALPNADIELSDKPNCIAISDNLYDLYSKILVVGVTFYTYATTYNQMALYIAVVFLLYLNKMKKI